MLCLVAHVDGRKLWYPLPNHRARLGRADENEIRLPSERGVSKHHAVLEKTADGRYLLTNDARSKNGVIVGEETVANVFLEPGTFVQLGVVKLTLEEGESEEIRPAFTVARPSSRVEADTEQFDAADSGAALRLVNDVARERRPQPSLERLRTLIRATSAAWIRARANEMTIVAAVGMPADDRVMSRLRAVAPCPVWIERIGDVSVIAAVAEHRRVRDIVLVTVDGRPRRFADWEKNAFSTIAMLLVESRRQDAGNSPAFGERDALRTLKASFVCESPSMRDLVRRAIRNPYPSDSILLLGETGTGKELMAKLLHDSGPFAKGQFVSLNCAALTESLADAELFGIRPKAATGVDGGKGFFLAANEGSIFLDEIGDLSHAMQAKLLRAMQERSVTPVGATAAKPIRLRVIAATNRYDELRDDLRYRFQFQFRIPPLRERREDIEPLVLHFLQEASAERGIAHLDISTKAMRMLREYEWPGNVRQLRNIVRGAVASVGEGGTLRGEHLELEAVPALPRVPAGGGSAGEKLAAYERELIVDALERHGGNKKAAAADFGKSREWLRQRIAHHGIATGG